MDKIKVLQFNKLRGKIAEKKISQIAIANLLKVSRVTVSNMLNGKSSITANQLYLISQLLECDMNYFFN